MNNATIIGDDSELVNGPRFVLAFAISIAYGLCFLLGFVGNCAVIIMILNIFFTVRSASISQHSTKHVFIYVFGLSIVDLFVILHLPFLITDIQLKNWIFGKIVCKIYWIGESVNKILSTFILTALSWDRYMAICKPVQSRKYRKARVACLVLIICTLAAVVLLMPVHLNAQVLECYILPNGSILECHDSSDIVPELILESTAKISRCVLPPGVATSLWFILSIFLAGFLIPGTLMVCFYALVLRRLNKGSTVQDHSNKVKKVTARILCVIAFYFICWTPYWLLTWLGQLRLLLPSTMNKFTFVTLFYMAHLLIYINSAVNPVLYALVNRELRQQHTIALESRRKSWSNVTRHTIEMFTKQGSRLVQVTHANKNAAGLGHLYCNQNCEPTTTGAFLDEKNLHETTVVDITSDDEISEHLEETEEKRNLIVKDSTIKQYCSTNMQTEEKLKTVILRKETENLDDFYSEDEDSSDDFTEYRV